MVQETGAALAPGQLLDQRFLVRGLLGSGGMGAVYEVEHAVTKAAGALKVLHPRYARSPDVVARFALEASAATRIGDPHIVQAFDAGKLEDGAPYIFMELLRGRSLASLIDQHGRLPFDEARELVLQAASGLAAAHAAGIVHRDVKPENLFLLSGQSPFVKILDFGVSRFVSPDAASRLTSEGTPLGTPYYMSPEQVVGERDVDQRADVYALGVVLYECLCGELPFRAETLPALAARIVEGRYTPLAQLMDGLPDGIDAVVQKALCVDLPARYRDMGEFAAALANIGSGVAFAPTIASEPVEGPRASPSPSADAKRSRARWLLPLALVSGGAGLTWWRGVSRQEVMSSGAAPMSIRAAEPAPLVSPPLSASAPEPNGSVAPSASRVPAAATARPADVRTSTVETPSSAASRQRSQAARDGLSVENPF